MNWIQNLLKGGKKPEPQSEEPSDNLAALVELRQKFDSFRDLVEINNEILATIGDMEEKAQGEFLFDIIYVRRSVEKIRLGVEKIIDQIVELGGAEYETLRARYKALLSQITGLLPGGGYVQSGPFVIDFQRINRVQNSIVGGKNAQLGEIRSLGYSIPEGFAISAWSFHYFLRENKLNQQINETLAQINIRDQSDLVRASKLLQKLIMEAPVPEDLAREIEESHHELIARTGSKNVALRSSAVGEDTLYSFAGQYSSFLNVAPGEVLDHYRQILASKYSPRALYYFLSHSLEAAGLSMSVGCTRMIDAAVSGVTYSRDPLDPDNDSIHIHSIYGLGPYLVGGVITPDVHVVCLDSFDIQERTVHDKHVQLKLDPEGGTREEPVPEDMRLKPSLTDEQLRELARIALKLEQHYDMPQDIEWAIDSNGQIFLLQSRPLRTICEQPRFELPDLSGQTVLAEGGTTICPGGACGKIVHVSDRDSMAAVESGDIIVAAHPSPSLVHVLDRAAGVITEVGSSASHMAALVREKRIPAVVGLAHARKELKPGDEVTLDAAGTTVYAGCIPELVQARRPEYDLFEDTAIFDLLRRLLKLISPLHLVNPADPDFAPERCRTLHDITRYAHQRGIEEVFKHARILGQRKDLGARLKTSLPFPVYVLNLDDPETSRKQQIYDDESIPSRPMQAFWNGLLKEKWPFAHPDPQRLQVARDESHGVPDEGQFTEASFVVIRSEYMLSNLNLGYHFTSVEAILSDDPDKNFIRFHYKGGGAADHRRRRRIALLEELLDRMGFEHTVKSDFIDCRAIHLPRELAELNLQRVGQVVMLTKQLDMALSNDRITRWYTEDIARKLDLEHTQAFPL